MHAAFAAPPSPLAVFGVRVARYGRFHFVAGAGPAKDIQSPPANDPVQVTAMNATRQVHESSGREVRWSRATVVALVALSTAIAGCGGSDAAVPAPVARGQALYVATGVNCIQCHADASALQRGAASADTLADRTAAAIGANTGNMGSTQYGYASLTRTQLLDIAAYVLSVPAAPPPPPSPPPPPTGAAVQCQPTGSASVQNVVFASALTAPWGMAFLNDGRVLVTQKSGGVVLISADGSSRTSVSWRSPAPQIRDGGQGGLLDVVLDPDFATNSRVYFTYQEPGPDSTSGTAVGRARLQGNELVDFQRLYQQTKSWQDGVHFGSRLALRHDGTLFVSLGDRGRDNPAAPTREHAQSLGNTFGKIVRIHRDGTIPADNPFQGQAGALPEIWSLGHRNPQGLHFDTATGTLWSAEHGPQGGDEINRVLPGANYAWPLRSYGCPYGSSQGTACRVGGGTHAPLNGITFNEPLTFWAPTSIAPTNVLVYRSAVVPEWNGQLFLGSLGGQLWRITLNDGAYGSCQGLPVGARVRDVRQGPDGWIWVLTDSGEIRRIRP